MIKLETLVTKEKELSLFNYRMAGGKKLLKKLLFAISILAILFFIDAGFVVDGFTITMLCCIALLLLTMYGWPALYGYMVTKKPYFKEYSLKQIYEFKEKEFKVKTYTRLAIEKLENEEYLVSCGDKHYKYNNLLGIMENEIFLFIFTKDNLYYPIKKSELSSSDFETLLKHIKDEQIKKE